MSRIPQLCAFAHLVVSAHSYKTLGLKKNLSNRASFTSDGHVIYHRHSDVYDYANTSASHAKVRSKKKPMLSMFSGKGELIKIMVYDLSKIVGGINAVVGGSPLKYFGLPHDWAGAWHIGILAWNKEWMYGSGGVCIHRPGDCPHSFSFVHDVGYTQNSEREARLIFDAMGRSDWKGEAYDILRHNCGHFAEEFATRLGVNPPFPGWPTRLANIGGAAADAVGYLGYGVKLLTTIPAYHVGNAIIKGGRALAGAVAAPPKFCQGEPVCVRRRGCAVAGVVMDDSNAPRDYLVALRNESIGQWFYDLAFNSEMLNAPEYILASRVKGQDCSHVEVQR